MVSAYQIRGLEYAVVVIKIAALAREITLSQHLST